MATTSDRGCLAGDSAGAQRLRRSPDSQSPTERKEMKCGDAAAVWSRTAVNLRGQTLALARRNAAGGKGDEGTIRPVTTRETTRGLAPDRTGWADCRY